MFSFVHRFKDRETAQLLADSLESYRRVRTLWSRLLKSVCAWSRVILYGSDRTFGQRVHNHLSI
jgi:hypothetical protein